MEDHAAQAVACALKMQIAMDEINALNEADGLPYLEMGIGVNTGTVVVGNIGSERRTKYSVVGAQVNFTGRMESYTVGGQVLKPAPDDWQDVTAHFTSVSAQIRQLVRKACEAGLN